MNFTTIETVLRFLFFALIVRPIAYVVLGLNVRHMHRLPTTGPAILVANHNSHLDTLVLMSLLPLRILPKLRPVAAADYFLSNPVLAWFALKIIGIIPISRTKKGGNPLSGAFGALRKNDVLIIYPEGTRGDPEHMKDNFKQGIRLIAKKFPNTPVSPIFLHGLGKALPKGETLFVPYFCDVFIGKPMCYREDKNNFMTNLHAALTTLSTEGDFEDWQ